ncbi:unnamed protein product [Merluccius merluccius]
MMRPHVLHYGEEEEEESLRLTRCAGSGHEHGLFKDQKRDYITHSPGDQVIKRRGRRGLAERAGVDGIRASFHAHSDD